MGLIIIIVSMTAFPLTDQSKVVAGPSEPWNVVETFWGTPSMPMEVGPGDQNVPLSIIIQYTGGPLPATGISIKLDPDQHLSTPTGTDPVAYPTLLSRGVEQSQTTFNPGDTGIIQYVLNIHPIALINHPYKMELRVMYFEDDLGDLDSEVAKVPFDVRILGRPQFEVSFLNNTLVAEQDNLFSIRITNIGSTTANDVNVELILPPPLILNEVSHHWNNLQIGIDETSELDAMIYAPELSMESTHQLSLVITYRDVSGNTQNETFSGGVVVHGDVTQQTSDLQVEFSTGNITGGRINLLSIYVNNFGSDNVYDVSVSLELPPPLILSGADNNWYFGQLLAQSTKEILIEIYAPEGAISSTFPIGVTFNFKDDVGVEQIESRNLGLLVVGDIDMFVYELSLFPVTVPIGGNFTVSGSLLNHGNIEAMYVNVSLVEDDHFRTSQTSLYYVGQVDPNAPVPFALTGFLQDEVVEGTYPLTILVSYQDNFGGQYTITKIITVFVGPVQSTSTQETTNPSITQRIVAILSQPIPLIILGGFGFVILYKLLRRKEEDFDGDVAL